MRVHRLENRTVIAADLEIPKIPNADLNRDQVVVPDGCRYVDSRIFKC